MADELLKPGEVAEMFRAIGETCDARKLRRWAQSGKLPAGETLGGQRRYRRSDVEAAIRKYHPQGSDAA